MCVPEMILHMHTQNVLHTQKNNVVFIDKITPKIQKISYNSVFYTIILDYQIEYTYRLPMHLVFFYSNGILVIITLVGV